MHFCVFRQAAGVQSALTRTELKIKCPALNYRNLPLKRQIFLLLYMHLLLSIVFTVMQWYLCLAQYFGCNCCSLCWAWLCLCWPELGKLVTHPVPWILEVLAGSELSQSLWDSHIRAQLKQQCWSAWRFPIAQSVLSGMEELDKEWQRYVVWVM